MTQLQQLLPKQKKKNNYYHFLQNLIKWMTATISQPAVGFVMMVFPLGGQCFHVIFRCQRTHWTELGGSLYRPRPWPLVSIWVIWISKYTQRKWLNMTQMKRTLCTKNDTWLANRGDWIFFFLLHKNNHIWTGDRKLQIGWTTEKCFTHHHRVGD